LSEQQQTEIRDLLDEYKNIFTDVPSITNLGKHKIQLTTTEPIKGKAYSLPHVTREPWTRRLTVEESSAAYASSVVIVKKPDGSTRVCIDYRKLNSATVFDSKPMPTTEKIIAKLAGDRYISMFDLSKEYWQVPVREDNRYVTTFICHRGLF